MEAELAALAASGATTLVGLMVSESWTQARDRVARFFARGSGDPAPQEQLEVSRAELAAARETGDDTGAADVEAEWRTRLRRLLRADPAAAAELRALLAELGPQQTEPAGSVHNTINGGVQHGPVIQGRDFSGLTFHTSGPQG
ncbi:hypothetical protein ACIQGZ_15560 [Streptomyces sp. NPDC092296]|uniref:hypothetical protein n=1 Tax=Streptomyces sp. NPDC092296 TaxID=3366012 RepID=UPI003824E6FC